MHSRKDERGQGTFEYVGMIALAAVVVAATLVVAVQAAPQLRDELSYQICRALNAVGGGECTPPRSAEERVPPEPCVQTSDSISAEVTASVVVTVKKGRQFLLEELSDGTYRLTTIDKSAVGSGVGPGADVSVTIDGKKYGVTAIASADALAAYKKGETWTADSKGEAEDQLKKILAGDVVDETVPEDIGYGPLSVGNPLNDAVKDLVGDPGDPTETFHEAGLEGSAGADLSAIVGGGGGSVKLSGYLGYKETPDGYTLYGKESVSAEAWAAVAGYDATAKAGGEVLTELEVDKNGQPQSVKVTMGVTLDADAQGTRTTKDDQQYTQRTYEVPLTGDMAHDAPLYGALSHGFVGAMALPNFMDKARAEGYVTEDVYSQDPNTHGINFTGSLLGEYGGSATFDHTTRNLQDSRYWDGQQMTPRPDC